MKNKYITLAIGAAIALSPLAALKAASLIGYGVSLNGNAGASLDANVNAGADASVGNSSAGAVGNTSASSHTSLTGDIMTVTREDVDREDSTSGSLNANVSSGQGSSASLDASVNARASGAANASVSANGNATSSQRSGTGVSTSAVAGENGALHASDTALGNANGNSILLMTAGNVATEEDLKAFATAAIRGDENLNSMSFTSDHVLVSYKEPGRFIGILPITMDVDVTVDQNGNVTFDYPWFGFLVAKDKSDLEARVSSEVKASASAGTSGWTNYDRAEIAAMVAEALRADLGATSTASTTGSGSL